MDDVWTTWARALASCMRCPLRRKMSLFTISGSHKMKALRSSELENIFIPGLIDDLTTVLESNIYPGYVKRGELFQHRLKSFEWLFVTSNHTHL